MQKFGLYYLERIGMKKEYFLPWIRTKQLGSEMWKENNGEMFSREKLQLNNLSIYLNKHIWCLQKAEQFSVVIVTFTIWHHAIQLIHQLCLHLNMQERCFIKW